MNNLKITISFRHGYPEAKIYDGKDIKFLWSGHQLEYKYIIDENGNRIELPGIVHRELNLWTSKKRILKTLTDYFIIHK